MRVSLRWLFDHIDGDYRSINVPDLVARFNTTVAEIDSFQKIDCFPKTLQLVVVNARENGRVQVTAPATGKEYELVARADVQPDKHYFALVENGTASWASLVVLGANKPGYLTAVHPDDSLLSGAFQAQDELVDWIFEVDNKSINHRPDLWGHRGLAREIAAMYGLPLLPLEQLVKRPLIHTTSADYPYGVQVADQEGCDRFALQYFESIENRASCFSIASRLARVDIRPISSIVDLTNYVMMDLGQPLHAFDAKKLGSRQFIVRRAQASEQLTLLDGQEIKLNDKDIVVATDQQPIALAGIMGGASTAVDEKTSGIVLESAHFNPVSIRTSAMQHKLRTDASSRFEKNLDPNQNIDAIARFNYLLYSNGISHSAETSVISFGAKRPSLRLGLEHALLERSLGVSLEPKFVIHTLEALGFGVERLDLNYTITVPSFRAVRDINKPYDLVEEIGRYFGYDNIEPRFASRAMIPFDQHAFDQMQRIKSFLAYGTKLQEVATYPFYDEAFVQSINHEPETTLHVISPVSQNYRRLVSSLVPNLAKIVHEHYKANEQMRGYFECARVWHQAKAEIVESESLCGIVLDVPKSHAFFEGKAVLQSLFEMLKLDVSWVQLPEIPAYWYTPYISCQIMHQQKVIGIAGVASKAFCDAIGPTSMFVFELDAAMLGAWRPLIERYKPQSKYPAVIRDISMFVPRAVTVDQLERALVSVSDQITSVELIDRFEKNEWADRRALTFRLVLQSDECTLTAQQADEIMQRAHESLGVFGAQIR